tara:strand:- start:67 stop:750 length:684 start_codon:yes stop_codon:yes gene_type:complete
MAFVEEIICFKPKLIFISRNGSALQNNQKYLSTKYQDLADIQIVNSPLNSLDSVADVTKDLDNIDLIFCAAGMLSPQVDCEENLLEVKRLMYSNYLIPAYFISLVKKKINPGGTIIGISSIAGERGRKQNYFYGAPKSAFTNFLSGLRQELSSQDINVLTVIPGFVKTKMITDLKTPKILTTSSGRLAKSIIRAIKKRKSILHPGISLLVSYVVRLLPEFVFKNLNF